MRLLKSLIFFAIVLSISLVYCENALCKVVYVNAVRTDDSGDGLSWATAKKTIGAGITLAVADDEIWVAEGTYTGSVTLKSGITLYGGFGGNETLREERNWKDNTTIIDGDKRVSHIITTPTYPSAQMRVDGFTICKSIGSAIYFTSGPLIIANNNIVDNKAGIEDDANHTGSAVVIANNVFSRNTSSSIVCDSNITTITNNIMTNNGAGISIYYGTYTIANNTIVSNTGAGISCSGGGTHTVSNNIISFNGEGILRSAGTFIAQNNDVYGNSSFNYSGLADPTGSNDNISTDPMLTSVSYGEMHLLPDSPCKDHGNNSAIISGWPDIDGQSRKMPTGGTVDIGADESDGTLYLITRPIIRVSNAGFDSNTGEDWSHTKRTLQAAVDALKNNGGEVWVSSGIYNECISIPSYVYLYGGFSGNEDFRVQRDWNQNSVTLDGGSIGSVVTITSLGHLLSTVDGFTLQNGKADIYGSYSVSPGAGIDMRSGSATLKNNRVINNNGVAIACMSSAIISDNIISNNSSNGISTSRMAVNPGYALYTSGIATISGNIITKNGGPGIFCMGAANIQNNTISSNSSGIRCYGASKTLCPIIANNVIIGNLGSGIGLQNYITPIITNNTITGNGEGGIYTSAYSIATVSNNIIAYNTSGIYVNEQFYAPILSNNCVFNPDGEDYHNANPGEGDIAEDPRLVAAEYGEVHLKPDSPCINSGNDSSIIYDSSDIDGNTRLIDGHVDIGVDEFNGTPQPSFEPLVVRVSSVGDDSNDGSSWSKTKRTVQAAIDTASEHGGEVWVAQGIYDENLYLWSYAYLYGGFCGNEESKAQRNWAVNRAVLDGKRKDTVVSVIGCRANCIDGFTITNGFSANEGMAAGIECLSSSPTISHNIITCCNSPRGGISCDSGTPTIFSNLIVANNTGISCGGSGKPNITNNTIVGNNGSGVNVKNWQASATLTNNIISFNDIGISVSDTLPLVICFNCISGNQLGNYFGIGDLTGTDGNISVDPKLANLAYGNFHIQRDSPCIDKGNNNVMQALDLDIDGQTRINDGIVDIGADEYWKTMTDAKKQCDNSSIALSGMVVTASFPGFMYVESEDRTQGVRVDYEGAGLAIGAKADVIGTMATNADGEHYISASSVSQIGAGSVDPLSLNNKWLGGGPLGYQGGVWGWQLTNISGQWQREWKPVNGLNNIGLLIKTWGKIISIDASTNSFVIDDGSSIGIKCIVPSGIAAIDPDWTNVSVTGVCSCEKVIVGGNQELHPVVRIRTNDDISPLL